MRVIMKTLLFAAMLLCSPEYAGTCSCIGGVSSLSSSLASKDMAFVGLCSAVKNDTVDRLHGRSLELAKRHKYPLLSYADVVTTATFIVSTGLKECRMGDTVIVRTPSESNACGVTFYPEVTYAVFGSDTRKKGRYNSDDTTRFVLEVNKCSATTMVTQQVIDTLHKITGLKIVLPKR